MVLILRVGMVRLVGMAVSGLILMLLECALLCERRRSLSWAAYDFFLFGIASLVFAGLPRSLLIDYHAR